MAYVAIASGRPTVNYGDWPYFNGTTYFRMAQKNGVIYTHVTPPSRPTLSVSTGITAKPNANYYLYYGFKFYYNDSNYNTVLSSTKSKTLPAINTANFGTIDGTLRLLSPVATLSMPAGSNGGGELFPNTAGDGNGGGYDWILYEEVLNPSVFVNINGVMKQTTGMYVNINGTWRSVGGVWVNVNGIWRNA